jgi:methylisocitrate lyase
VRALLGANEPIVMGGIYDGVSARLVEEAGFPLAFMGGYAVAASLLGEPDIGLLTQAEMADAARRLCRLVSMPVLVDADTGYGGIPNVVRTAELYAQAGAAGLFLEDQVWPKRCGHMSGKEVVPREDWLAKLRAVLSLRPAIDLFVVARTDARGPKGLEEAIRRGRAAVDLGVDAVFVEAPQSVAELDAIALGIRGPKVANMVEWGKTPIMSPAELHQRGFDLIVYPVAAILAQAKAVGDVFKTLRRDGSTAAMMDRLLPFEDFNALVGLERHRAREAAKPAPARRSRSQPAAVTALRSRRSSRR